MTDETEAQEPIRPTTAMADFDARYESARKRHEVDARFRAITDAIVARVLHDHWPVDPDNADRAAYRIAKDVAALVLETVFAEDQELRAQRAMADQFRKIAEDALAVPRPPMMFIPTPPPYPRDPSK